MRALGTSPDSPELREAAALAEVSLENTGLDYPGRGYYLESADASLDVLIEGGVVSTFFLGVRGPTSAYARLPQLVPGLSADSTPSDLRALFGPPLRSSEAHQFFDMGGWFVSAQFEGDVLQAISVTATDVLAPTAVAPTGVPAGEVGVFFAALGAAEMSPEVLEIIVLAGPRMERHEVETSSGPGAFVVFDGGGVDLQFAGDALQAVLIHLRPEDGRAAYPRPEALIDGLTLPASRAQTQAVLGAPTQVYSQPDLDLYAYAEGYLHVGFEGDRAVSLTVVEPPRQ